MILAQKPPPAMVLRGAWIISHLCFGALSDIPPLSKQSTHLSIMIFPGLMSDKWVFPFWKALLDP